MNFFDYDDENISLSGGIWLFFVFTVPVTFMAWLLRVGLRQKSEQGSYSLFKGSPFLRNKRRSRPNSDDDSNSSDTRSGNDIKLGGVPRQNAFSALASRVK